MHRHAPMKPRSSLPERVAACAQNLAPRLHALAIVAVMAAFMALAWAQGWSLWQTMAMGEFAAAAALISGLLRLADFDAFAKLVVASPRWLQRALASRLGTAAIRCFDAGASRAQALLLRPGPRLARIGAFAVLGTCVAALYSAGWPAWKSLAITLLVADGVLALVMLRWLQLLLRDP